MTVVWVRMARWLAGAALVWAALWVAPALAQQQSWLQVEAQPSLDQARRAARDYALRLDSVAGYRLGSSNWHAIVIGPLSPDDARALSRDLRRRGAVPGDAFVTDGANFRARFWPDGDVAGLPPLPAAPPQPAAPAAVAPLPNEMPPDESPAEARLGERALTAEDRRLLQTALRWEGFYDAAIDGAFGRGTRAAMSDWQRARGLPQTGILTTAQRTALIGAYRAVLADLGMRTVTDAVAGIRIDLPTARVAFDRHDPPFAHYAAVRPEDAARVLLISRAGSVETLHGLYDIMQTLSVVPRDGPRSKSGDRFTLTGTGDGIVSHTEAALADGAVKGFTLIWPEGDERRRLRLLDEMRRTFSALPGQVMGNDAGIAGEDQSIDLLAGLEIRRPRTVRTGFYATPRGDVLTASDAVDGCASVTLDDATPASVRAFDAKLGLALLEPERALAPRAWARLQPRVPRLRSQVVLAGWSFGGALGAPSLTYGALSDMRGIDGEADMRRYALAARPGDAGGPVLDDAGAVLGLLLPADESDRVLPGDVATAADVGAIAKFLSAHGISAAAADPGPALPQAQMSRLAADLTVRVGCWD